MTPVRLLAAVIAGLALAAAALGFVVQQSLSDTTGFVTRMDTALSAPEVQSEIEDAARTQVLQVGERVAQSAGPLGDLARSATAAAADRAAELTRGPAFADAWSQWCELLYSGLVASAVGTPNDDVSVAGSDLTVGVGPLIRPLVGDTLAGGVADLLGGIGQSTTITLATGVPLEQGLQVASSAATNRWFLIAIAVAGLLIAALPKGRRVLWAGWTLAWCAVCVGTLAVIVLRAPAATTGDYPALSAAVVSALTQPWGEPLTMTAAILAVVAVALLLVGALRGSDRRAGVRA